LIIAVYMIVVMIVIMKLKRNTEKKRHNSQLEVQWQKWLMKAVRLHNATNTRNLRKSDEPASAYNYTYIRKARGTTQGRKCCRNSCYIEVMFTLLSKHWWTKNVFQ
jgi:hypothetical protein